MSRYINGKNIPNWVGLLLCLLMGFVFVCIGTGIEQVEILVLKEEKLLPIGEDGMTEEEREIFDLLRECRSKLAKANGVAPFMIFSNATLMDMAKKRPRNTSEFKRVSGVGEMKAQWYGRDFLKVLKGIDK